MGHAVYTLGNTLWVYGKGSETEKHFQMAKRIEALPDRQHQETSISGILGELLRLRESGRVPFQPSLIKYKNLFLDSFFLNSVFICPFLNTYNQVR